MHIKKIITALFLLIPLHMAMAADTDAGAPIIDEDAIIPVDQLLSREPDPTECATRAFAAALEQQLADISEDIAESEMKTLIYTIFAEASTLEKVLACPEVANADEEDSIKFMPIEYTFPGGRKIVINYETQPKILQHRLRLANKQSMPGTDPSPRLGDLDDDAVWTNTDPAWYAIMVTKSGALSNFVGDGKNNTISLKYIEENIDSLYPSSSCTDKSALADDDKNINEAVRRTVGAEDDSNDYYVAGDVNLQWISYLEIAADVVLTVVTFGGGAVISGVTKAARASKVLKNLTTGIRALAKTESVTKYVQWTSRVAKAQKELDALKALKEIDKLRDSIRGLDRVRDASKIADLEKQIETQTKIVKQVKNTDSLRDARTLENEIAEGNKTIKELETTDDAVKQYNEATKTYSEINKYRHKLMALKRQQQTGNIARRGWRSFRASATGTRKLDAAEKVAQQSIKQANKAAVKSAQQAALRAAKEAGIKLTKRQAKKQAKKAVGSGIKTGRLRNWLFHSTMKSANKLARFNQKAGLLYGAIKFAGDMYDWTETSTGEFTNDIDFKPLLLLSADDLEGQDNVVNYGMWLMWQGDSYSVEDDDAAYLQAMDFAETFYNDLLDIQDEKHDNSCDVDIYVVRPIIRNPDTENAELYYLIMNDIPWSTVQ